MALNYGQTFAASTTWQVLGTVHGIGHAHLRIQTWDAGNPRQRVRPATLTVDATTFTVTATFLQAQAGILIINGAAPLDPAQGNKLMTFASSRTWIVPGTDHGFGTDHLLIDAYDAQTPARWLPAAPVRIDQNTYTVTVQWAQDQAGSLVIGSYADRGTPNFGTAIVSNPQVIPGTTHQLGTAALGLAVYDAQSPMHEVIPATVTVHPVTFDVSVSFLQAQAGTLVLGGSLAPPVAPAPLPPITTVIPTATKLQVAQAQGLARWLRHLPVSLWDSDPTSPTLQRDLAGALASQSAVWLEQRDLANQMTLLLEAQGVDLDVLMQDYGLKRYMRRTDAYARQIAEQILFRPQCTQYAIDQLTTLLFDPMPHLTLRTGRGETTVLVAQSHPVTVPYTYWGLIAQEGFWYAVSVDQGLATATQNPPPGLNVAPGPHTLSWFTALDELNHVWYVGVQGDTLVISQTQPTGVGSTALFQVLDGSGGLWQLSVSSQDEVLVPVQTASGQPYATALVPQTPFQALQLLDANQHTWWLSVAAHAAQLTSTLPGGAANVTPAGGPYYWLRVYDLQGQLWYAYPSTSGVLQVSLSTPGGLGTAQPQALGDAGGILWHYGINASGNFAVSSTPSVDFGGHPTTLCMNDGAGIRWFWRVRAGHLEWSRWRWPGSIDQSPWGEIGWVSVPVAVSGGLVYVYPAQHSGAPTAAGAPPIGSYWGWAQPVFFWDEQGTQWQLTATALVAGQPDYWQLVDGAGTLYYFWIDAEMPTISTTIPPGGNDMTPGGMPLRWFTVADAGETAWYVQITADALEMVSVQPGGLGTDVGAILADSNAILWSVNASATGEALVTVPGTQYGIFVEPVVLAASQATDAGDDAGAGEADVAPVPPPLPPPRVAPPVVGPRTVLDDPPTIPSDYWRIVDSNNLLYALFIEAEVAVLTTTISGGNDRTPGGTALHWFTLLDETSATWYGSIDGATVQVTTVQPSGTGTSAPPALSDAQAQYWQLTVGSQEQALVTSTTTVAAPPVSGIPGTADYWRLVDDQSTTYALFMDGAAVAITTNITGGTDRTPGGTPLPWLQLRDEIGALWYLSLTGDNVQVTTTQPAGSGYTGAAPVLLDAAGGSWTLTVASQEEVLYPVAPGEIAPPPPPADAIPANAQYWRLTSDTTAIYGLYIDAEMPAITPNLTSGHDVTPGGGPLDWFVVTDQTNASWYVQVVGDTLQTVGTQPAGTGSLTTASLTDNAGAVWTISVEAQEEALVTTLPQPPDTGTGDPPVPGTAQYWRLLDPLGTLYALYIDAEVPAITTNVTGGTDVTPGGSPLNWFVVLDEHSAQWFAQPQGDSLNLLTTQPAGSGAQVAATLADPAGQLWSLTASSQEEALVTTPFSGPVTPPPVATPGATWRVSVQQVPSAEQVPPLEPRLDLRDAADAIGHIQPAGGLISIIVT